MAVVWKHVYFKGKPEQVFEEIKSIGDEATPTDILEYARANPESELHKCFEWDDTVAAENWRKQTARQIVCNLVYTSPKAEPERPPVRVMYCVESSTGKPTYKPTTLIVRNEDNYQSMLTRAYNELRAFKVKYQCLTELEEIFDLIN